MILLTSGFRFESTKDVDYFCALAQENNKHKTSLEETRSLFLDYGIEFWKVYLKDELKGIIGYFKVNEYYILEGLVDKRTRLGLVNSIKLTNVIIDYMFKFTDKIRTCARVEDRAIQILCGKLGFKQLAIKDGIIVYEKEK